MIHMFCCTSSSRELCYLQRSILRVVCSYILYVVQAGNTVSWPESYQYVLQLSVCQRRSGQDLGATGVYLSAPALSRSRNCAPFRKGCVANGKITKTSKNEYAPRPPPPASVNNNCIVNVVNMGKFWAHSPLYKRVLPWQSVPTLRQLGTLILPGPDPHWTHTAVSRRF